MIVKKYKRCPRCDSKNAIYQDRCDECGLVFDRLKFVTNSAAKKAIKNKEYNKVINYNVLPRDVNKWKLFFLALFFGWVGAHFAKVGKYKSFIYMLVAFILFMLPATTIVPFSWFDEEYLFLIAWGCVMPASIATIIWLGTTFQILFGKFKVPVAIDEELVKEDLDDKTVKEILTSIKKDRKEKSKQEREEEKLNRKKMREKITVVCASCGETVKVRSDETICPKCDEPLKGD